VPNTVPHSLSFVSLRWMLEQTIRCQTSILYNPGALKSIGFTASPFIETHINTLDHYFLSGAKAKPDGSICDPEAPKQPGFFDEEKAKKAEKDHIKKDEQKAKQEAAASPGSASSSASSSSASGPTSPPPPQGQKRRAARQSHATDGTLVTDLPLPVSSTPATERSKRNWPTITKKKKSKKYGQAHSKDATDQTVVEGETEEQRQRHDVLSPVHDELKLMPLWWILEVLPMLETYQDEKGKWHRIVRINLGRPRRILSTAEPKLHISVKQRMEAGIGYKPKAKMLKGIKNAKWTE